MRDSSLSACTQAVMAAEVGHLDLAYDYLAEAALIDLHDLAGNTDDGLHIASLAGTWIAVVHGLRRDALRRRRASAFAPRLPPALSRISFGLTLAGPPAAGADHAGGRRSTTLVSGPPMRLTPPRRAGRAGRRSRCFCPIPAPMRVEPVEQPYGRAPRARHPGG